MLILGAIVLLAFLGTVEPYKLGPKPQTEFDNPPPPPPPSSQPQPPPVQQPERLEQQTLLYPNNDYVQHEQKYEASGTKGGLKGERELINRQPSTGYLPNSPPQALAYVIVRPLQYNPSTYGVTYSNGGSYPYGNDYGYNNGYNNNGYNNGYNRPPYSNQRPPYNPYNQNPYNPYGPYNTPQSSLQSENPSLRDETQQLEEEYPTKGGVKQAPPPSDQQLQQPPPQQGEGFDLYAEKKGKLQRLVDKIHSIFPFGSTYQINDEVPPPQSQPPPQPQPQPAQPPQLERAPEQQQIREPIPEQQTLSQLHDEQELIREPEPINQEPLREEKGHSKPYRETAAGDLKRERDHLNNQQLNLSQEPDYNNVGFASSKRVSAN